MAKYRVMVREMWIQGFEVIASSKEEALAKTLAGEADAIDNDLEYSHTMDEATSTDHVELIDGPEDTCAECGEPIMDDPDGSSGVLVHDTEDRHDRDEDHVPYRSV